MAPPDPPASPEPKSPEGQERSGAASSPPSRPAEQATFSDLVSITLDPLGGRVVRVEYIGAEGERHEMSAEEAKRLKLYGGPEATLQGVVEKAFQAGIDCVLGDGDEEESTEDAELSRVLLQALIERSPVTGLMKGEVLDRAIIGTLIKQAGVMPATPPKGARTTN